MEIFFSCAVMIDMFLCVFPTAVNDMEKKLAEFKCDTNEAVCLKLGKSLIIPTKEKLFIKLT